MVKSGLAVLAGFTVLAATVSCSDSEPRTEQSTPVTTAAPSQAAQLKRCEASGYTFENTRGSTPCEVMIEAWITYRLDNAVGGPHTLSLKDGTTAFCTDTTRTPEGVKGTCEYNGSEFRARM